MLLIVKTKPLNESEKEEKMFALSLVCFLLALLGLVSQIIAIAIGYKKRQRGLAILRQPPGTLQPDDFDLVAAAGRFPEITNVLLLSICFVGTVTGAYNVISYWP